MSQHNKDTTLPPSLTIDWEAYLPFLENEDISEDQKRVLIETLWGIMAAFVDLGFKVHPVPHACGEPVNSLTDALSDVVSSANPNTTTTDATALQFGKAAGKDSK